MRKVGTFAILVAAAIITLVWSVILPVIGVLYLAGQLN
jgi:hypothetical protein